MRRWLFSLLLGSALIPAVHAANSPNILLVVLDDWGWRDAGFMGNPYIETPTLDRLASEGMAFQQAYANAPNCAPSRAALMSGQYAPRTDVYTMLSGDMGDKRLRRVLTPPNKMYLEPDVVTLAEVLKSAGYRTAHIGKWNLGSGPVRGPEGQGFDINKGGNRNGSVNNGHFAPYQNLPGLEQAPAGEYLTDRLTEEAIRIIQQKSDKPFFIHLSHFAPHFPFQAPQHLVQKYIDKAGTSAAPVNDPTYAAMVDRIDQDMGKILAALEQTQQLDNTLIAITSDNGGYEDISWQKPLRGEKSLVYEGGIRVPLLFWWKGHIRPGRSEDPVIGIDLFPTLAAFAGAQPLPATLDGVSLQKLLLGKEEELARDALYWYFPAYVARNHTRTGDGMFLQRPAAVIRAGDWKLIHYFDHPHHELYNLAQDPSEQKNLWQAEPQKAAGLNAKLMQWLDSTGAPRELPANPAYDADFESAYLKSWWRQLRWRLAQTRWGAFLREEDL